MYIKDVASNKEEWLNAHEEEIVVSRRMSQLERQYDETMILQEKLKAEQYPMNRVAKEIAATVPDELNRISSFQLLDPSQLTLTLENTEAKMAQEIVEEMESLHYIEGVQLLYAESQSEDDTQLRFELIINLDNEIVVEEDPE